MSRSPPGGWRRARRVAVRVIGVAGVLVVALALAATGYLLSLRGVGDARARVEHILAAHGQPTTIIAAPPRLAASVVSVEDEHFYDNIVVNVLSGAGRAALAALQTSRDPGGSTIDQQLAKRLYGHGSGVGATLREIGLGVKLALRYSKHELLAMYVNAVYYGHGYWGLRAAAHGYFHVAPSRLTWAEAAMLAGLLQAPSAYDPIDHYALAKRRQRHVLHQLVANGYLSRSAARSADVATLPLGR